MLWICKGNNRHYYINWPARRQTTTSLNTELDRDDCAAEAVVLTPLVVARAELEAVYFATMDDKGIEALQVLRQLPPPLGIRFSDGRRDAILPFMQKLATRPTPSLLCRRNEACSLQGWPGINYTVVFTAPKYLVIPITGTRVKGSQLSVGGTAPAPHFQGMSGVFAIPLPQTLASSTAVARVQLAATLTPSSTVNGKAGLDSGFREDEENVPKMVQAPLLAIGVLKAISSWHGIFHVLRSVTHILHH
ncbi:hypothetical protein DL96DRAFT_1563483 [Flagelloscypha sp. PMI_526]|nr:hypothetical protein DL96DRAFT_1563483 [Flagelloscypha sp. PMI_526]